MVLCEELGFFFWLRLEERIEEQLLQVKTEPVRRRQAYVFAVASSRSVSHHCAKLLPVQYCTRHAGRAAAEIQTTGLSDLGCWMGHLSSRIEIVRSLCSQVDLIVQVYVARHRCRKSILCQWTLPVRTRPCPCSRYTEPSHLAIPCTSSREVFFPVGVRVPHAAGARLRSRRNLIGRHDKNDKGETSKTEGQDGSLTGNPEMLFFSTYLMCAIMLSCRRT